MANPLSTLLLASYAAIYDFRSNFANGAKQVLTAYGLPLLQPGQGIATLKRTATVVDFSPGAATGVTAPMAHDFGAGTYRHSAYAQFEGVLTFACYAPYETTETADGPLLSVAGVHARELDQRAAQLYAIFMEAIEPFKSSGDYLPKYDIQQIIPIEPDERPANEREANIGYVRFRIRFQVRQSAWPA